MSQPAVTLNQLDGQLGILPPSSGRLFALVGACTGGTLAAITPAAYGTIAALQAALGAGPLLEAAAHYVERYGRPVLVVKTATSSAASATAITFVGTGTSVPTVHASPTPNDDYEVKVLVIAGGTVGVAGITYQVSLDGGRTYGATTALGTASNFTLSGAGGVQVDLAAGTLVAGDTLTFRTTAATWNSSDMTAALAALGNTTQAWRDCAIVGALDGTTFDAVDAAFVGFAAAFKYRAWIGAFRTPTIGESEATYKTAFDTAFSAKVTIYGAVCAGACKVISSISGRKYRRSILFPVAARQASVSEEVNIAAINVGALPGVDIRDSNGNPDEHDESVNPGLDDSRALTLRTWIGVQGVYVNRPRILSASGSDFDILPKRETMNLALDALYATLIRRLNVPVRVNPKSGFIFELDARDIETNCTAAMGSVILDVPKASDVSFVLARNDNVLSTKTLRGEARITPLGYPETIIVNVGFQNPALQVVTA